MSKKHLRLNRQAYINFLLNDGVVHEIKACHLQPGDVFLHESEYWEVINVRHWHELKETVALVLEAKDRKHCQKKGFLFKDFVEIPVLKAGGSVHGNPSATILPASTKSFDPMGLG